MKLLSTVIVFSVIFAAHAEQLNVKSWNTNSALNAVGNGTTDDAPAIQAAINSLTNGGTLYFPSGTYLLNATVNTGNLFYQNYALWLTNRNILIKGDGDGSVLLQTNCQTTLLVAFFDSNIAGLSIEDIKFQGDMSGTFHSNDNGYRSGTLFVCNGIGKPSGWSKGLTIRNVTGADKSKNIIFHIFGMDDVVIDGCRFIHIGNTNGNTGAPSIWSTAEGIGSLRLINNYFDGDTTGVTNYSGADGLIYQQAGEQAVITGNTLINFKLEGIQCGARQQTICNNIFRTTKFGTGIYITPQAAWSGTNIQLVVANNVQDGGAMFLATFGVNTDSSAVKIDASIINNVARLGQKESGISGIGAIWLARGNRVVISGNTFENYADGALYFAGTGQNDASLNVQGNVLTSMANSGMQVGILINRPNEFPVSNETYFRNITVLNNIISGGDNGSIIIDKANTPTNLLGKVIIGNNIYLFRDNASLSKWIRVDNTSVSTASTNLGGYVVTDLNP